VELCVWSIKSINAFVCICLPSYQLIRYSYYVDIEFLGWNCFPFLILSKIDELDIKQFVHSIRAYVCMYLITY
jgi:hypothetical protein